MLKFLVRKPQVFIPANDWKRRELVREAIRAEYALKEHKLFQVYNAQLQALMCERDAKLAKF